MIKSQTNTTIMKQQARVFSPATHIQANRRRRVRFYKEANKDLSVQLNGTAFMRSFLCSGTHTHKHTLSSRYLLTALVRIVFTSLSTSSPLSTVYFKFHFIGRFISAKRMSVWLTMCMSLCLCVNVWFFRMKKKWKKTHIARASSLQCVRQTRVMEHERTGAIVWAKECLWCSVRVSEWVSSHMYVRIVEIHCVKWSYLTFS